jgi:hypothetical protein
MRDLDSSLLRLDTYSSSTPGDILIRSTKSLGISIPRVSAIISIKVSLGIFLPRAVHDIPSQSLDESFPTRHEDQDF